MPLLPVVLLYTRMTRECVLDQGTRLKTLEYFRANPGATVGEAAHDLGVDYKTTRHHAQVLRGFGLLQASKDGRFTRYAPPGHRKA